MGGHWHCLLNPMPKPGNVHTPGSTARVPLAALVSAARRFRDSPDTGVQVKISQVGSKHIDTASDGTFTVTKLEQTEHYAKATLAGEAGAWHCRRWARGCPRRGWEGLQYAQGLLVVRATRPPRGTLRVAVHSQHSNCGRLPAHAHAYMPLRRRRGRPRHQGPDQVCAVHRAQDHAPQPRAGGV